MGAHTKLSAKGQVVIPKELRERLRWVPGTALDVVETAGGLILRPRMPVREGISWEEFRRRVPRHEGPPISIEDMHKAVDELFASGRQG